MIELYCVGDSVWPFDDFFPFQKIQLLFFFVTRAIERKKRKLTQKITRQWKFASLFSISMPPPRNGPRYFLSGLQPPFLGLLHGLKGVGGWGGGGLLAGPIDQKG